MKNEQFSMNQWVIGNYQYAKNKNVAHRFHGWAQIFFILF